VCPRFIKSSLIEVVVLKVDLPAKCPHWTNLPVDVFYGQPQAAKKNMESNVYFDGELYWPT